MHVLSYVHNIYSSHVEHSATLVGSTTAHPVLPPLKNNSSTEKHAKCYMIVKLHMYSAHSG